MPAFHSLPLPPLEGRDFPPDGIVFQLQRISLPRNRPPLPFLLDCALSSFPLPHILFGVVEPLFSLPIRFFFPVNIVEFFLLTATLLPFTFFRNLFPESRGTFTVVLSQARPPVPFPFPGPLSGLAWPPSPPSKTLAKNVEWIIALAVSAHSSGPGCPSFSSNRPESPPPLHVTTSVT